MTGLCLTFQPDVFFATVYFHWLSAELWTSEVAPHPPPNAGPDNMGGDSLTCRFVYTEEKKTKKGTVPLPKSVLALKAHRLASFFFPRPLPVGPTPGWRHITFLTRYRVAMKHQHQQQQQHWSLPDNRLQATLCFCFLGTKTFCEVFFFFDVWIIFSLFYESLVARPTQEMATYLMISKRAVSSLTLWFKGFNRWSPTCWSAAAGGFCLGAAAASCDTDASVKASLRRTEGVPLLVLLSVGVWSFKDVMMNQHLLGPVKAAFLCGRPKSCPVPGAEGRGLRGQRASGRCFRCSPLSSLPHCLSDVGRLHDQVWIRHFISVVLFFLKHLTCWCRAASCLLSSSSCLCHIRLSHIMYEPLFHNLDVACSCSASTWTQHWGRGGRWVGAAVTTPGFNVAFSHCLDLLSSFVCLLYVRSCLHCGNSTVCVWAMFFSRIKKWPNKLRQFVIMKQFSIWSEEFWLFWITE